MSIHIYGKQATPPGGHVYHPIKIIGSLSRGAPKEHSWQIDKNILKLFTLTSLCKTSDPQGGAMFDTRAIII